MLPLLTKYLFQYKTVGIPHVGTIQIVQNPAQLDVVDKRLSPPFFMITLIRKEEVSEHQLNFIKNFLGRGRDETLADLKTFGDSLQAKIDEQGFEWNGLGIISRSTPTFSLAIPGLQSITAQKIIRANTKHDILVGDQHMTSLQMAERRTTHTDVIVKRRSWIVIAGWTILLLSVLIIAIFLFTGKFRVNAAGSRWNPMGYHNHPAKLL